MLSDSLSLLKLGLAIVDLDGSVTHQNDHARTLLSAPDRKAEILVKRIIADASRFESIGPKQMFHTEASVGGRRLQVGVLHYPECCFQIWLREATHFDEQDRATLKHRYALTPREVELTTHLAGGQNLASFAQNKSIARETAKSHLRSIFRKTRCTSQTQLVVLLWSTLR